MAVKIETDMNFERKGLQRKSRTGDVCCVETQNLASVQTNTKCGLKNKSGGIAAESLTLGRRDTPRVA